MCAMRLPSGIRKFRSPSARDPAPSRSASRFLMRARPRCPPSRVALGRTPGYRADATFAGASDAWLSRSWRFPSTAQVFPNVRPRSRRTDRVVCAPQRRVRRPGVNGVGMRGRPLPSWHPRGQHSSSLKQRAGARIQSSSPPATSVEPQRTAGRPPGSSAESPLGASSRSGQRVPRRQALAIPRLLSA
jgi:hypothetical protein